MRTGLCSRTCCFAKVKADQEANDPYDHEAQSDEVEFADFFSEALPFVRIKVEEEEQKEARKSAGWPGGWSMDVWGNRSKERTG